MAKAKKTKRVASKPAGGDSQLRDGAGSPHLAQLRRLGLESNQPGHAGIQAIAKTKHLTQLEYINTHSTWLTRAHIAPIAERFPSIEIEH